MHFYEEPSRRGRWKRRGGAEIEHARVFAKRLRRKRRILRRRLVCGGRLDSFGDGQQVLEQLRGRRRSRRRVVQLFLRGVELLVRWKLRRGIRRGRGSSRRFVGVHGGGIVVRAESRAIRGRRLRRRVLDARRHQLFIQVERGVRRRLALSDFRRNRRALQLGAEWSRRQQHRSMRGHGDNLRCAAGARSHGALRLGSELRPIFISVEQQRLKRLSKRVDSKRRHRPLECGRKPRGMDLSLRLGSVVDRWPRTRKRPGPRGRKQPNPEPKRPVLRRRHGFRDTPELPRQLPNLPRRKILAVHS
mmetsp:Transcript_2280/g.7637  ORF Transcript_2280/g.7637 Transcript_2280/m.7637 type:complete len:303 (+) Transcript_2280:2207-3115(+)